MLPPPYTAPHRPPARLGTARPTDPPNMAAPLLLPAAPARFFSLPSATAAMALGGEGERVGAEHPADSPEVARGRGLRPCLGFARSKMRCFLNAPSGAAGLVRHQGWVPLLMVVSGVLGV